MADHQQPRGRRLVRRRRSGRTPTQGASKRVTRARRVVQVVIGVVAAGVVATVGTVMANRHAGQTVGQSVTTTLTSVLQGNRTENILLIGNNARDAKTPTAPGQADLIYVVHFVPSKHSVTVISVPRDTMFAFPGWNNPIPKIKSALLMGGPTLEEQSVSKLLGMPIQGYVEADFAGFAAAIDAVGGVYLDIPARLYDPTFSHANFYPGYQHLNGTQALAYVRIRQNQAGNGYRTNYFERQAAGTQVMLALKKQVLAHESLGKLTSLVGVLRSDFATNLSSAELVGLLASADHAAIHSVNIGHLADTMVIDSTAVPGVNSTGQITGAYYDILTPQGIDSIVAPYGGKNAWTGLAALPAPSSVSVALSDNTTGVLLANRLKSHGFTTSLNGPAPSGNSIVVGYPAGQLPAAEAVGRALGNTNEVLQETGGSGITITTP